DAIAVGNSQRRRADDRLNRHMGECRLDERGKENDDETEREGLYERAPSLRDHIDEEGKAHMLGAVHGADRAEHAEPEEDDAVDLVDPEDRRVHGIAKNHPDKKEADHHDEKHRAYRLDDADRPADESR